MKKLIQEHIKSFSRDEKGATMVEYAVVVGVIAFVAIAAATTFGTELNTVFTSFTSSLTTVNGNVKQ